MARRCPITGKAVLVGMNVSHAHNRTKRRFLPNLQQASLLSETLGHSLRMRVSTRALRTIEIKGGLDAYVAQTPNAQLTPILRKLKRKVLAKGPAQKA